MSSYELKDINLKDIFIGDRFRKFYGNLEELKESISNNGIISSLAVCPNPHNSSPPYLLLAGGRRIRALQELNIKTAPCRVFPSGTEFSRRTIELEENIKRSGLNLQERARLTEEIHKLHVEEKGESSVGRTIEGHTVSDTAEILGVSRSTVTQDLEIAKTYNEEPELLEPAKNRREALKLIQKKKEEIIVQELSKRVKNRARDAPKTKVNQLIKSYIVKDAIKGMEGLKDNSFDIAEIDPPYGVDLLNIKYLNKDVEYKEYEEIDKSEYYEFLGTVLRECSRVLSNNSWVIIWYAQRNYSVVYELLEQYDFTVRFPSGIWYKGANFSGQTSHPEHILGSSYETFIYANRGKSRIVKQGTSNVFNEVPILPALRLHPLERPIELIQSILRVFTTPTDKVLCPFLGSGNTILACSNLDLDCTGFDSSEKYKDSFVTKLDNTIGTIYKSSLS